MFPRLRILTLVFAASVTTTHFNCIAHSAQGAGLLLESYRLAAAGEAVPFKGDLLRCPNESGCICRGAVLVAAVVAPALDLTAWDFLALPPTASISVLTVAQPAAVLPSDLCRTPVPISGKILRAWISSFLC